MELLFGISAHCGVRSQLCVTFVSSITACSSRWRRACQSQCQSPSSSPSSPLSAHRPSQPQPPSLPSSGSISPPSSRAMPLHHPSRMLLLVTMKPGLSFRPFAPSSSSCIASRSIIIFGGESQGGFAQGQTYLYAIDPPLPYTP